MKNKLSNNIYTEIKETLNNSQNNIVTNINNGKLLIDKR